MLKPAYLDHLEKITNLLFHCSKPEIRQSLNLSSEPDDCSEAV